MGTKDRHDVSTGGLHPASFITCNNMKVIRNARSRKAHNVIFHTLFIDNESSSVLVHDEQRAAVEKEV
jgi:hypothetical protein